MPTARRVFRFSLSLAAAALVSGCALGPSEFKPGPAGAILARDDVYADCRARADAVPAPVLALQDPFLGSARHDYLSNCMQHAGYYPTRLSIFP